MNALLFEQRFDWTGKLRKVDDQQGDHHLDYMGGIEISRENPIWGESGRDGQSDLGLEGPAWP
jgi:hypothetical protein